MFWKKKKPEPPKRKYIYAPLPDITAHELAQLVLYLIPTMYANCQRITELLPPECLRHLKVDGKRLNEIAYQLASEAEQQKK